MKLRRLRDNFFLLINILSFFLFASTIGLLLFTISIGLFEWEKYWEGAVLAFFIQVSYILGFWLYANKYKKFNKIDLVLFLFGLITVILSAWIMSDWIEGVDLRDFLYLTSPRQ